MKKNKVLERESKYGRFEKCFNCGDCVYGFYLQERYNHNFIEELKEIRARSEKVEQKNERKE